MNRQEAISKLVEGKKITHYNFVEGEYVQMLDGHIFSEDGVHHTQFWELRSEDDWDSDWSIFEEPKTNRITFPLVDDPYSDL